MASQLTQNPLKTPVQAAAGAVGSAGGDPRASQKTSFFQGLNEGPGEHAAQLTGVATGGKRVDVCDKFEQQKSVRLD